MEPPASPGATNTWGTTQTGEKVSRGNLTISAFLWLDTLGAIPHQSRRAEAAWEADPVGERRTGGLVSQGGAGGLALVVETVAVHETTGALSSCSRNLINGNCKITRQLTTDVECPPVLQVDRSVPHLALSNVLLHRLTSGQDCEPRRKFLYLIFLLAVSLLVIIIQQAFLRQVRTF